MVGGAVSRVPALRPGRARCTHATIRPRSYPRAVASARSATLLTRRRALLAIGLALVALAVYAPVADFEFVDYDDDLLITTLPEVREGLSTESVRWAFTTFQAANWIPLTRLSWMLDIELFGLDPGSLHVTNALLHALATALLLLGLAAATGEDWKSAWVAGVFALHPLHVESVAWIASRRDVLSGVFAAASLLAYVAAVHRGGRARHGLVFVLLAAGLMSKPTLMVWPFLFLLLDAWPLRRLEEAGRLSPARVRAALWEKLPLFALAAGFAFITVVAQSRGEALRSLDHVPLWVRSANALASLTAYTADAFWPRGLAAFYPHPGASVSPSAAAVALVGLGAGALAAPRLWRTTPAVVVGMLWFVLALLPVIGLVQVGQAARADRYTYLPLIGLAVAVAWGLAPLLRARAALAVGVASLLALAAVARPQIDTWRDSGTLFRHALQVTERNHVAHINLAGSLLRESRWDEASSHLTAALRIAPGSAAASGLLGDVRVRQDRVEEAIRYYRQAVAADPDSGRWRVRLAGALAMRGRMEEAQRVLDELNQLRRER